MSEVLYEEVALSVHLSEIYLVLAIKVSTYGRNFLYSNLQTTTKSTCFLKRLHQTVPSALTSILRFGYHWFSKKNPDTPTKPTEVEPSFTKVNLLPVQLVHHYIQFAL